MNNDKKLSIFDINNNGNIKIESTIPNELYSLKEESEIIIRKENVKIENNILIVDKNEQ